MLWTLWELRVKFTWRAWFLLEFISEKLASDKEGPIQWRSVEHFQRLKRKKVIKAIFCIFTRGLMEVWSIIPFDVLSQRAI